MSGEDHTVLWQRVDEHTKRIQKLEVGHELTQKALEQHQEEFRRLNKDLAHSHSEILTKLTGYGGKVDLVIEDYHQRQGAKLQQQSSSREFKWTIGTLIGVFGLVIAFLAMKS